MVLLCIHLSPVPHRLSCPLALVDSASTIAALHHTLPTSKPYTLSSLIHSLSSRRQKIPADTGSKRTSVRCSRLLSSSTMSADKCHLSSVTDQQPSTAHRPPQPKAGKNPLHADNTPVVTLRDRGDSQTLVMEKPSQGMRSVEPSCSAPADKGCFCCRISLLALVVVGLGGGIDDGDGQHDAPVEPPTSFRLPHPARRIDSTGKGR